MAHERLGEQSIASGRRSLLLAAFILAGAACTETNPGTDPMAESDTGVASDATARGETDGSDVDGGAPDPDDGVPPLDAGGMDADPPVSDAALEPDAAPDRTDEVYDRARLLEVEIELDPADFQALRTQRRDGLNILGPECALPPSPFTWFSGRVTVDGEVFENVGVRKKGFFGSVSNSRPSFKVRFDKFEDDQTFLGVKRLTLNNARQDPSKVRQCLAYDLFRAGGTPASRCNFARVTVNGEDLGVYTNIESIKKPFLRRHFDDDDGNLYEGTLSDFREGWTGTYEQKTNEEEPDTATIDAISAALEGPDEMLLEALSGPLDLDAFFTFWATEILVAHWDGYSGNTNNHYFYVDPDTGKARFIPWGTDGTFMPPIMYFERREAPRSVNAAGLLARRLYRHPEGQRRYLERLTALLDAHWDPDALRAQVESMDALIGPHVLGPLRGPHRQGINETLGFIAGHGDLIRGEIEGGPVSWDTPLRGGLCQTEVGTGRGSFETTWRSWPTDNTFATGSGDVEVDVSGDVWRIDNVGAAAGFDDEERTRALLLVPLQIQGGRINFFSFVMPVDLLAEPQEFVLGRDPVTCELSNYDTRNGRVTGIASCPAGKLTMETVGLERGDEIRGRFLVQLFGEGG